MLWLTSLFIISSVFALGVYTGFTIYPHLNQKKQNKLDTFFDDLVLEIKPISKLDKAIQTELNKEEEEIIDYYFVN